jgi:hypothetical protein
MLFQYPISATSNNWLHDCLIQILQSIHTSIQAGETPDEWPNLIPNKHRKILKSRTGLKSKLEAYKDKFGALDPESRVQVTQALTAQNQIAELLSCQCNCEPIEDLPDSIQEEIKELFSFSFKLLTDLGIRDIQYKHIYDQIADHVCPFCGFEYFDAPGAPREDLDHYLAKKIYPFSGANLRNLVPMGVKCNQKHKLTQDILKKDDGSRRRSFYPYNHDSVTLSLENSQPFEGKDGEIPEWKIDFSPDIDEVKTWDNVFHIRERYKRDVLDDSFKSWLMHCYHWCKHTMPPLSSKKQILNAIDKYSCYMEDMGLSDRAFLKAAVFRMLHQHCQNGDDRLLELLSGVMTGEVLTDVA